MNNLKVIILAAGEGKRLRPLTNNIPKCMVDFFGRSLLQRQIDIFQNLGIPILISISCVICWRIFPRIFTML